MINRSNKFRGFKKRENRRRNQNALRKRKRVDWETKGNKPKRVRGIRTLGKTFELQGF